jgi:subtilisin family serine protease
VILQAKPGRFEAMLAAVQPLQLSNVLGSFLSGGLFRAAAFASLSADQPIPSFGMHASVYDGWTLNDLANLPDIEAIYEDRPIRVTAYPVVPAQGTYTIQVSGKPFVFTSTEWTRRLLGADVANGQGFRGEGVRACVVDTGGTRAEPSTMRMTRESVIPGNPVDAVGHGQWCAAALGGRRVEDYVFSRETQSSVVCEGMAPDCDLMQVKALDYLMGFGMSSQLLAGLEVALQAGADVLSLSWGGPPPGTTPDADPFFPALDVLDKAGILIAAAAGNSGPGAGTIDSPGSLPQALAVGAYNAVGNTLTTTFGPAGEVCGFSSRGPTPWGDVKPDTVAPGAIIDAPVTGQMSAAYTHRVHAAQALAGTSMATPILAGILTLMRQAHQALLGRVLSNAEVKAMLAALGQPKTNGAGWGPLTWDLYRTWLSTQYGVTL